jgi:membrane-associated PAP2 superfamily phosphatase
MSRVVATILIAFALLLFAWDATGLDLAMMRGLGGPAGFAWRDAFVTRVVLHDGGRIVAALLLVGLVVNIWKPIGPMTRVPRADRVWCLAACVACLVGISLLKRASLTSCPWSLAEFGGVARYVSHWAWGVADGGGGSCFPSGHASSAFGFMPIVAVLWGRARRAAWWWVAALALFGLAIGCGQVMRGAHHPSHVMWTAWCCAAFTALAWFGWGAFQRSRPMQPETDSRSG